MKNIYYNTIEYQSGDEILNKLKQEGIKPLPCPFCASKMNIEHYPASYDHYGDPTEGSFSVECPTCENTSGFWVIDDINELIYAILTFNQRANINKKQRREQKRLMQKCKKLINNILTQNKEDSSCII